MRALRRVFVSLSFLTSFAFPLQAKTVWDGVYTSAQAERGQTSYAQYCIRRHKADLMGIEGAMKGEFFMERRREDTLETRQPYQCEFDRADRRVLPIAARRWRYSRPSSVAVSVGASSFKAVTGRALVKT